VVGIQPVTNGSRDCPWDASYHDGPAPWDIGQPQPAIVRLASEGGFVGAVLDAGCGTGENALHVAWLGLSVLGVDVAATALAIARAKADDRGIEVEFAAADAFRLKRLGRRFASVLDCGLFHTIEGDERPGYVASGVQPPQWMDYRRHRTGPDADELPPRRRTGLVGDNQTDLDCRTGRPGERSRAVTHD
jgi:SAM-dependent methyltransferase